MKNLFARYFSMREFRILLAEGMICWAWNLAPADSQLRKDVAAFIQASIQKAT